MGAGVGVMLVAAVLALVFLKRRRQSASRKLYLVDDGLPKQNDVSEVASKALQPELYSRSPLYELPPN